MESISVAALLYSMEILSEGKEEQDVCFFFLSCSWLGSGELGVLLNLQLSAPFVVMQR